MALDFVHERATALIDVSFWDEDGLPATPTTATYRIDDVLSGVTILPATSISALASVKTLEITPTQNAILSEANVSEARVLTLDWTYGASRRGTDYFRYVVRNLVGITS